MLARVLVTSLLYVAFFFASTDLISILGHTSDVGLLVEKAGVVGAVGCALLLTMLPGGAERPKAEKPKCKLSPILEEPLTKNQPAATRAAFQEPVGGSCPSSASISSESSA